ncbi:MAG: PolC-type DNA polymerase III [Erysipelotrichia bacterium]|nr:PolC-type DNA polymerase III [Erysipelotrichia bacterium]
MNEIYELAQKLKMNDSDLHSFEKAVFLNVPVFHKVSNCMNLAIEFESLLPYHVYDVFVSKLKLHLKCRVSLQMKNRQQDYDVIDMNKYVKQLAQEDPYLKVFMNAFPAYEKGVLTYKYIREEERKMASDNAKRLQEQLLFYGIDCEVVVASLSVDIEMKSVEASVQEEKRPVEVYKQEPKSFKRKNVKEYMAMPIKDLTDGMFDIKIQGKIFDKENIEMRNGKIRQNLYITDLNEAIRMQRFERGNLTLEVLNEINAGDYVVAYGSVEYNKFTRDNVFKVIQIDKIQEVKRVDRAKKKRVELHTHTKFSEMDGVCDISEYIKQAAAWGHNAIAISDHMVVQGFPMAQEVVANINKQEREVPFKMLYGVEMNMVDPQLNIVRNVADIELEKGRYCIFDLETTGSSSKYDHIIEFGGQIMDERNIVGSMQTFIKPPVPISAFTTNLTGISENDVVDAKPIEEVIDDILAFIGDRILVAHNADFDVTFLNDLLVRLGREPLKNPVIDTLDLDRSLHKERRAHRLGNVARYYGIKYDEDGAHRADYDANVLVEVFLHMLNEMPNIHTLEQLSQMYDESCFTKVRTKHVTVLARNAQGLKELFELVSLSHVKYLAEKSKSGNTVVAEPRILRSEIEKRRVNGNLLIGSSCVNSDVFEIAQTRGDVYLKQVIDFYDYIEVQPLPVYMHLVHRGAISDVERLKEIVATIVRVGKQCNKIVVASGDVHYCDPNQKQLRDIYIAAQAVGGVHHPLYIYNQERRRNTPAPDQHLRTTDEMLSAFAFLGDELANEIVVENTNRIADMVEPIYPVKDRLYPPSIDGCAQKLSDICYQTAHEIYGDPLPDIVEKRLKRELDSIIGNGFEVVYYVSHLLVKKSLDDGYMVGSRGSVGSSFVATMSNITEVNPLAPHYVCPQCKFSEFFSDGRIASGYDLPDKKCPKCGAQLHVDGQDIPFETFLGFEGDKVPDIDLNFSGDYQPTAHAYTKEVFGEDHVFRAGTIGTVADKTAFGYVKGYCEEMGIENMSTAQTLYLSKQCAGVKRASGQHPGGIIVIPNDMDVHDFTPIQYPANDATSEWKTTHFDFHRIHDNVLKFDILGHVDPTAMKFLERISGLDVRKIPMNDRATMSIFSSVEALNIDTSKNTEKTGAAGIPEFGTAFVRGILELTKPTTFDELLKISGLSHGTDVWLNNAKDLIDANICTLKDVIGCRDDIMVYLLHKGLKPKLAFTIMESVRKGKGLKEEWIPEMKACGVEDYYIESCKKIKYMFPKAHAVAYVMMAIRIAWFKVHKPIFYYCMFFSLRCDAYDIEAMIHGESSIRMVMSNIQARLNNPETKRDVSKKEMDTFNTLELALEMILRGYRFGNIDLMRSDAKDFIPDPENPNVILPPFASVDGLGENVAITIVEARNKGAFLSKQDLSSRTGLNGTNIKKLEELGVLNDLQNENQMSLF